MEICKDRYYGQMSNLNMSFGKENLAWSRQAWDINNSTESHQRNTKLKMRLAQNWVLSSNHSTEQNETSKTNRIVIAIF